MDGRVQHHLEQAARYSRFVTLMRRLLPLTAGLVLMLLFVWPSLQPDPRNLPEASSNQREMTNLRYSGLNSRNEPMVVVASRATQVGPMEAPIDLENVTAELTRANGSFVRLQSQTGRYDQKANHILLTGAVHVMDKAGYDITTESAEITLNTPAQAWGDKPVTGKGPQGNIRANGFRITDEGRTVIFTGRSRLELPQGTK